MIQCQICKIQYVGQTKNKILQRINQHYSSIRNKLETPVARPRILILIEVIHPLEFTFSL